MTMMMLLLHVLIVLGGAHLCVMAYNPEIQARVQERVADFLRLPVDAIGLTNAFRQAGGTSLQASERNRALQFLYTQVSILGLKVYFGLEDGTFLSYQETFLQATYREPGNGGYQIITEADGTTRVEPEEMAIYHDKCVNAWNGTSEICTLRDYDLYIECDRDDQTGDCNATLSPCADAESQRLYQECRQIDASNCSSAIKWCQSYTKRRLLPDDRSNVTTIQRGFVPYTASCIDVQGQLTQTRGEAIIESDLTGLIPESIYGDCLYRDGITLVEREEAAPFAYCSPPRICNDTFLGGQASGNYDPRYRPWYEDVKREQIALWSEPYPFFPHVNMGITYGVPIYSTENENDRQVFEGVLAIDYILESISSFLRREYEDSEHIVAIIEPQTPHYVIGLSTGSDPGRKVLVIDDVPTLEGCPDASLGSNVDCTTVRVSVDDLASSDILLNQVIRRAFYAQQQAGFPSDELVSLKQSDAIGSPAYSSHIQSYIQGNLEWSILVVSPLDESTTDTVNESSLLMVIIILLGSMGFTCCSALFYAFWKRRKEPAMIVADWRFTSAFLAGCATLNLSTFTLLGENTDAMCMLRMWSFHLLFVAALSPLFVKVWRMYKILSNSDRGRRIAVTNKQAALYVLPLILIQILILIIFSIVDPPRQTEAIDISGFSDIVHTVTCQHKSPTFAAVQFVFDAILIFLGCGLAYLSRNLDPRFGEGRQLIFALYNIAFTGIIIVLILVLVGDMTQSSRYALQATGVFWASLVGCSTFVLPRLMQVKQRLTIQQQHHQMGSVRISGVNVLNSNLSGAYEYSSQYLSPDSNLRETTGSSISKNLRGKSSSLIRTTKQEEASKNLIVENKTPEKHANECPTVGIAQVNGSERVDNEMVKDKAPEINVAEGEEQTGGNENADEESNRESCDQPSS